MAIETRLLPDCELTASVTDMPLFRAASADEQEGRSVPTADNSTEIQLAGRDGESIVRQIREQIGDGWVNEIVVEPLPPAACLAQIVDAARQAGRAVIVVGDGVPRQLPPSSVGERWVPTSRAGRQAWLLASRRPPWWQLKAKRVMDIVLATWLLVLLSPVLLVCALMVRLLSGEGILYPWRVLGRNGRPFTGYKFRTMVEDADQMMAKLRERNEMEGPVFKMSNDPRVTRPGRWLRKYSLDELPQLWSVLRGDMSLVGPRPVFRHEYRQFELWQMRKLSVTPGMTCLWQVSGRNSIKSLSDWVRLDLQYIDGWSLELDFKVLLKTVKAVVSGTGQ